MSHSKSFKWPIALFGVILVGSNALLYCLISDEPPAAVKSYANESVLREHMQQHQAKPANILIAKRSGDIDLVYCSATPKAIECRESVLREHM